MITYYCIINNFLLLVNNKLILLQTF